MRLYFTKQKVIRAFKGFNSLLTPENSHLNVLDGLLKVQGACNKQPLKLRHDDEEPVFLFATGWRTGSTLMQRILVTDPQLLVWGEPHGDLDIVNRLGEIIAGFSRPIAPDSVILSEKTEEMSGEWIANLYPRTTVIRQAMQSLVYDWLAAPAKELGYARWGMKEVRLGYEDAALLLWLFPKARFVVVTRNPYDSYRSAMQLGALWERWPDRLVNDAYAYGRLWNRLALSWQSAPPDFPVRLYRLEDVTSADVDFQDLAAFCKLDLKPEAAIGKKVGSARSDVRLSFIDKLLLDRSTRAARNWLRY
ncbi:MAG: hypothetical protein GC183_16075 [Thiobacillus sp.]|nr:hypothetical protein [Thiobacillus sp.]